MILARLCKYDTLIVRLKTPRFIGFYWLILFIMKISKDEIFARVALSAAAIGLLWTASAFITSAHDGDEVAQAKPDRINAMRQERQDARQDVRIIRKDFRVEVKEKRDALQNELKAKRMEVRDMAQTIPPEDMRQKREEFRKEVVQKHEELRKEIKSKHEEFKQKAQERKDELKKKIGEERARRVEDFFTRMANKLSLAIERLDKLADRIESRLDKISESGKDVSILETKLENARTSITSAQKALEDAKAKFTELAQNDNPKEAFPQVRELISQVSGAVKSAHAALVDVIGSIKRGRLDETATTTPQQ